jgi:hypothetical protein
MMTQQWRQFCWTAYLVVATVGGNTAVADPTATNTLYRFSQPETEFQHRFCFGYRLGYGIKTDFKNVGSGMGLQPGPAVGGISHTYDNGYVKVDSSGNAGGETWNWGYDQAGQLQGNQLVFHASTPDTLGSDQEENPQQGFQMAYTYCFARRQRVRWEVEAAFNFTDLTVARGFGPGTSGVAVHAYPTGNMAVPQAPYAGTYAGPGPLLVDTPALVPVSMSSKVDATVYGFQLGPAADISLCKGVTAGLGAGVLTTFADTEFSFTEQAGNLWSTSGRNADWSTVVSGYVSGRLDVQLKKGLSLFAGIQYLAGGDYTLQAGDKAVTVSLGNSVWGIFGLSLAF